MIHEGPEQPLQPQPEDRSLMLRSFEPVIDLTATVADRPLDKTFFYLAADLFNNGTLVNNILIGSEIFKRSGGKYVPDLPQNLESNTDIDARHPFTIRANDLKAVFVSDASLYMFEGMSLDDGMLIELGFAKALGIPSVVIRTDFRKAGDQEGAISEPWNLMASDWPNHEVITSFSMEEYRQATGEKQAPMESIIETMYRSVVQQAVEAFKQLEEQPPTIQGSRDFVRAYFQQLVHSYDGSGKLAEKIDDDLIDHIIDRRIAKGTIGIVPE